MMPACRIRGSALAFLLVAAVVTDWPRTVSAQQGPPGEDVASTTAAGMAAELTLAIDGLQRAIASGGLPAAAEHAVSVTRRASSASLDDDLLVDADLALARSAFAIADIDAARRWLDSARERMLGSTGNALLRLQQANVELRLVAEAGRMAKAYEARLKLRDEVIASRLGETVLAIENQNFIAGLLIELNRPHEAAAMLVALARQLDTISNPDATLRLDVSGNLVLALAQSGRIEEARRLARRNLETVRDSYGERGLLFVRHAALLALVEIYGGSPATARPAAELALLRAADEFGESGFPTIQALELLTYVSARLARTDDAITTQQRVVRSLKARLGAEHPRTLLAEGNLAAWQLAEGSTTEALPTMRRIAERVAANEGQDGNNAVGAELDLIDALLADRQVDEACSRVAALHGRLAPGARRTEATYGLAQCHIERGRLVDARNALEDVVAARSDDAGASSAGVVDGLAALARVELAAGDESAALRVLERLYRLVEADRLKDSPAPGSGRALFSRRAGGREQFAGYRDLAALYAKRGRTNEAIRIAEQARGRALNEALSMQRYAADATMPQGERLRLRSADLQVRSLDGMLALSAPGTLEQVRLSQARDAAAGERERITQALERSSASRAGADAQSAVLRAARGDEAVIGFQWSRGHVWAYVLRSHAAPAVVLLDTQVGLQSALVALRAHLTMPAMRPPIWRTQDGRYALGLSIPEPGALPIDARKLLDELHRTMLEPLRSKLIGARRLIVVADGPLAGFPFEILERDAKPIGLDYEVRYAASLAAYRHASWLSQRQSVGSPRTLRAIGAPDYGALGDAGPAPLRGRRWPELPGAAAEIESIAAHFAIGKRTVLLGHEATRENLVRVLSQTAKPVGGFVHVAAHAYLSADAPQWSSLVLGSETRAGPGYVTAAELAAFEINAELVTLSACETALGREMAGEGLFGLPYALAIAGAHATLLTLWPVADESTAEFMKRFYAKLARGAKPAAALARTKREFMRHPRWGDPFFWAPFVLYGAA